MKKTALFIVLSIILAACSSPTAEDRVKAKMEQKYSLTAAEQLKAETSAKQFFSKQFPAYGGTTKAGMFQECRPTDSNFNGLVTCMGYIPNQQRDTMELITRYCTYREDMVMGCSNEDK